MSPDCKQRLSRIDSLMRAEFFADHQREFATIAQLQAALDAWLFEQTTRPARPR